MHQETSKVNITENMFGKNVDKESNKFIQS